MSPVQPELLAVTQDPGTVTGLPGRGRRRGEDPNCGLEDGETWLKPEGAAAVGIPRGPLEQTPPNPIPNPAGFSRGPGQGDRLSSGRGRLLATGLEAKVYKQSPGTHTQSRPRAAWQEGAPPTRSATSLRRLPNTRAARAGSNPGGDWLCYQKLREMLGRSLSCSFGKELEGSQPVAMGNGRTRRRSY